MPEETTPEKSRTLPGALMFIIGSLSLIALIIGPMLYFDTASQRARHALVASLPPLQAAKPGQLCFAEGRVSPNEQPLRDEFVAFIREQYTSNSLDGNTWREMERKLQPLTIQTNGDRIEVINADYDFDRVIAKWTSSSREDSPPTATKGSVRIEGLVTGSPVMVIGYPAPDGSSTRIVAQSVAGVNRETYLERLSRETSRLYQGSIILMALAPFGIAYAVWTGFRIVKAP